jgi:nitronate monooxygenase
MTDRARTTPHDLAEVLGRLSLPAIAAPMTGVSTPALVAAACSAGVIGSFPTSNCRSAAELDEWFDEIAERTAAEGPAAADVAANLIVHRQNERLDSDLACLVRRRVKLVITSVGNPGAVVTPLHEAGCAVFADVASVAHSRKALDAGVDGLVLLSAGAGGHTGWANPFAFVRAVRAFYDGPLVLAGGVSDGTALWSAVTAGYDLGYLGTKLIATRESGASDEWRAAVIDSSLDDVTIATAPNGLSASLLRAGGSAGHTVSGVSRLLSVREVVAETVAEWHAARADTVRRLT